MLCDRANLRRYADNYCGHLQVHTPPLMQPFLRLHFLALNLFQFGATLETQIQI